MTSGAMMVRCAAAGLCILALNGQALAKAPPKKAPKLLDPNSAEGKACTQACGRQLRSVAEFTKGCKTQCVASHKRMDAATRKALPDFMKTCHGNCAEAAKSHETRNASRAKRCFASCSREFARGYLNVAVLECQMKAKDERARMWCLRKLGPEKFQEVLNRAKTTEAIDMLDTLWKCASFFYTDGPRGKGKKKACTFPASVACTPAPTACDKKTGQNRFKLDPKQWQAKGWKALKFKPPGDHYYRYCAEAKGKGANATFTIKAIGDLDCDGIFSTYTRTIRGKGLVKGSCEIDYDKSTFTRDKPFE